MPYDYSKKRPYIGKEVAERDGHLLNTCFIPIPSYDEALKKQNPFMVGRKGIGKTAIAAQACSEVNRHCSILFIRPKDIDLAGFTEISARYKAEWPDATAETVFYNSWRMFYLINAMKHGYQSKKGKYLSGDAAVVYRYLKQCKWISEERIVRLTKVCAWIIDVLTSVFKSGTGNANLVSEIITDHIVSDVKFREAYKSFKNLLSLEKKPFLIITDSVDERYEYEESLHEYHTRYYRGLINAVYSLSEPSLIPNFYLKAYIPSDIFDHIQIRDRGKIDACRHRIKWPPGSLKEMICLRLARSLKTKTHSNRLDDQASEKIWQEFFPRTVQVWRETGAAEVDSYKYILGHTLMRPRDLIQICNMIFDRVCEKHSKDIGESHIEEGLRDFSASLKSRVVVEFKGVLPQIDRVLDELSGGTRILSSKEVSTVIAGSLGTFSEENHVSRAIQVLYNAGILGVRKKNPRPPHGYRIEEIYSYNEPLLSVSHAQEYVIHRGFARSLELLDVEK